MSNDIVQRIRDNLPHIEWEQPLAYERELLAVHEIERLRRWKAEAMRVLLQWDEVFESIDPDLQQIGVSKTASVLAFINRHRDWEATR